VFKRTSLVSAFLVGAIALTGCGSDSGTEATPSEGATSAAASDIKVGLAYDIGGRGDQSFNDAAAAGLDRAVAEFGVEVTELEAGSSETDAQKEERLRLLAQGGHSPVIGVGFAYAAAMGKVAAEFPETDFAIVDDASEASTAANIANLIFAEEQGSYLVGVIAAEASEADHVGFVGGVNIPLIKKFEAGFVAGAQSVKPDIKVDVKYLSEPPDFSGFGDPAKGKVAAEGMFQDGADVVYHAAGGSGGGVFQAAKDAEGWAIGVDSDQYLTAGDEVKDVILTSMIKRVDVAVYDTIKAAVDGSPLTGVQVFDLAAEGVGYSTSNPAVAEFQPKADEASAAIIDGSVTVPTS
jgi:basic membrane protein A and related proteins